LKRRKGEKKSMRFKLAILALIISSWVSGFCIGVTITSEYARSVRCDDMVTDMDITLCTGDVDPADPLEDEHMYYDKAGCQPGECD
jgi:hypothetical protein